MGEKEEMEVGCLRVGIEEERITEGQEEGRLTPLTDLGERLPILEGCTSVCFTRKGGIS